MKKNMDTSIGVNLRVTAHSNQGGRKYMEDMFCVAYQPTADDRDLLYAYFGIFDGHGGREAALYAKHHLMDEIVQQKNFWSDDDELVLKAIHDGFLSTHQGMWKEQEKWPKTTSGLPSTSGTTASIAFVRRGKLYIGHVGDSGIVMGYEDPETGFWRAKPLTKDHKPESPAEMSRINEAGGKVIVKSGVPRVVWNRPRLGHKGPVRRSTHIDEIPFLAVARSLGDLWSYNSETDEFVVSPEPDVSVVDIDIHSHRCLILGTDGLWNMLSPQDAVNSVYFAEKNNERQPQPVHGSTDLSKSWINPSKRLVDRSLDRWLQNNLRADNTSVVTVVVDPPGPPKVPVTSPVGISRYVPQKLMVPVSTPKEKVSTPGAVDQPCSSSASVVQPSARIPSISHPRVIAKTTTGNSTAKASRTKGKVQKSPSSTLPAEATSNELSSATVMSSPEVAPNSPPLAPSRWKHIPRTSPVNSLASNTSHLISRQDSGTTDDVQIHEISSSSESTKSIEQAKNKKKRKASKRSRSSRGEDVPKEKEARTEESVDRRPTTRNSTLPVLSLPIPKRLRVAPPSPNRSSSSSVTSDSLYTRSTRNSRPARPLLGITPSPVLDGPRLVHRVIERPLHSHGLGENWVSPNGTRYPTSRFDWETLTEVTPAPVRCSRNLAVSPTRSAVSCSGKKKLAVSPTRSTRSCSRKRNLAVSPTRSAVSSSRKRKLAVSPTRSAVGCSRNKKLAVSPTRSTRSSGKKKLAVSPTRSAVSYSGMKKLAVSPTRSAVSYSGTKKLAVSPTRSAVSYSGKRKLAVSPTRSTRSCSARTKLAVSPTRSVVSSTRKSKSTKKAAIPPAVPTIVPVVSTSTAAAQSKPMQVKDKTTASKSPQRGQVFKGQATKKRASAASMSPRKVADDFLPSQCTRSMTRCLRKK